MVRYVRCIIANNNDIIVDVTTLAQIIVDQLHLKSYTSQSCIMTFYLDVLASPRYTRYSDYDWLFLFTRACMEWLFDIGTVLQNAFGPLDIDLEHYMQSYKEA